MHGSEATLLYGFLAFGLVMLFLAVVGTCTGEAWGHAGRLIYRAKEPEMFWFLIAAYYLLGAFGIGYFLYKIYVYSN